MANLAVSAVAIQEVYKTGGTNGRRYKAVDAILTLTGQGGLTNLILASLFGMSKITEVRDARTSANVPVSARPAYDGSSVVLSAVTAPVAKTYVVTGLASTGNITATGAAAGDLIESVVDLTTPGLKTSSYFTPGTNIVTQASGAGDLHLVKLLIITRSAPTPIPTDSSATVRLTIIGNE